MNSKEKAGSRFSKQSAPAQMRDFVLPRVFSTVVAALIGKETLQLHRYTAGACCVSISRCYYRLDGRLGRFYLHFWHVEYKLPL